MTQQLYQRQPSMNKNKKLQHHQQMNTTTTNTLTHTYQLRSTTMTSKNQHIVSSTAPKPNTTPTGLRKTCGLFDANQPKCLDTGTETLINKLDHKNLLLSNNDNYSQSINTTAAANSIVINSNNNNNNNSMDLIDMDDYDMNFLSSISMDLNNSNNVVANNSTSTITTTMSNGNNSINELDFEKPIDIDQHLINESMRVNTSPPSTPTPASMPMSKFMQKVQNANMKIQMPVIMSRQDSFNFHLDDELKAIITPSIQEECLKYIQEIPTPSIQDEYLKFIKDMPTPQINLGNLNTSDLILVLQTPVPVTAQNVDNNQILQSNDSTTNIKYSKERNPFLMSLSSEEDIKATMPPQQPQHPSVLCNQGDETCAFRPSSVTKSLSESICLDHDYTKSPKKRKNSINTDDDSVFSFDTSSSPAATTTTTTTTTRTIKKATARSSNRTKSTKTTTTTTRPSTASATDIDASLSLSSSSSSSSRKRQRIKGIYRAEDVHNDDDRENYLERRRKNNISSKQSRLSKKNLYASMDEKANQLERENERLKQQAIYLDSLTKLLKDVLLQRITSNIK